MINGPEALHPGQRVHPRRERGPRLLRRGRVLRPRHRRRRRHRPADGALDRRGRARARPLEDGHPPVRRRSTGRQALHARAHDRGLRDLLRHPLPERGAPGRPAAAASRRPTTRLAGARARSFGEKSGWERPELVRARTRRRPATRRSGRAAGPGEHWSPAIGAEALATRAARPACSTRRRFAKIEVAGPGALGVPPAAVRQRRRPAGRARSSTPSCSNRRGGIECDLTVTRLADDRFLHRDRAPPSATTTCGWMRAAPAATTARSTRPRRHLGPRLLRAVGPAGPRHPGARVTRDDVSERGLPVPHRAARSRSARVPVLRAAGHLRRRARLGAVRAHRVRRGAVGRRSGRRAGRTAWSPAATGPSTRSGSRRATASGRATSRPTRRRTRPASGSRSRSTRASTSSAARRSSPREGGRAAQAPALPRPRRPALGLPRQRAGPGRRRDRRAGHVAAATASPSSARSPTPTCRRTGRRSGRAARSRSSASGSASRSPASRCTTRTGRGSARDATSASARLERSLRRGSDAELRGWLTSRWPAATRPTRSRCATSGATWSSRPKPDRIVRDRGRHGRSSGCIRERIARRLSRTTASSARSTAPRPGRRPSAGTSTRSTAPTTSCAACRSSGRCSRVERDGELQVGVISAPALGERWFAWRGGGAWAVGAIGPGAGAAAADPASRRSAASPTPSLLYGSAQDDRRERAARRGSRRSIARRLARARLRRLLGLRAGRRGCRRGDGRGRSEELGPGGAARLVEEAGGRVTDFDGGGRSTRARSWRRTACSTTRSWRGCAARLPASRARRGTTGVAGRG